MKKIFIILSLVLAVACTVQPNVTVKADFTLDKEKYDLFEPILPQNVSSCTGAEIDIYKWQWDGGTSYGETLAEPLVFTEEGLYKLTLTAVVSSVNVGDVCTKEILVSNMNYPPVASFTFSPSEIAAGETITFTSTSTDSDGTIISWDWTINGAHFSGSEIQYIFATTGTAEVTLTVTDNRGASDTAQQTLTIGKSKSGLDVMWEKTYGTGGDVVYSSPALSPDGDAVYVFSSAYELCKFDTQGNLLWTYDASQYGATSTPQFGAPSVTPSVADDGTIYLCAGYGMVASSGQGGVFAVNPDGTEKWHIGAKVISYGFITPAVSEGYLFIVSKGDVYNRDFHAYNASTGSVYCERDVTSKNGSLGGFLATKNNKVYVTTANIQGNQTPGAGFVYHKEAGTAAQGENWWKYYGGTRDSICLGWNPTLRKHEIPGTAQMAMSSDGKVYCLLKASSGAVTSSAVLYAYEDARIKGADRTEAYKPIWIAPIDGEVNYSTGGTGIVLGADGTLYVTTSGEGSSLTAVSPSGVVRWTHVPEGEIGGSAAVDNEGNIYYNDTQLGRVVVLSADGARKGFMALGASSLGTSPTIAPDGTLYVNGVKGGIPVLYKIETAATAPAASWSQLGGGHTKNPCRY